MLKELINLTKNEKNPINEESAGLLLSNFHILLKAYYERERESAQLKEHKVYCSYILRQI